MVIIYHWSSDDIWYCVYKPTRSPYNREKCTSATYTPWSTIWVAQNVIKQCGWTQYWLVKKAEFNLWAKHKKCLIILHQESTTEVISEYKRYVLFLDMAVFTSSPISVNSWVCAATHHFPCGLAFRHLFLVGFASHHDFLGGLATQHRFLSGLTS